MTFEELDEAGEGTISVAGFYEGFCPDPLEKDAYEKAGLRPEDTLFVDMEIESDRCIPDKGWSLFMSGDGELLLALYKDGKPMMGYYYCYRGTSYQVGVWLEEKKEAWYAHKNMPGVAGRSFVADKLELQAEMVTDVEIAKDFLLQEGIFK